MSSAFLSELIFLIIAAFVGGFCARTIKLPPVLGYIISGIVFGIIGKNFFTSYDSLVALSEVGVSLLLFTLGFEISLDALKKINKKVFIVGILNVVLVAAFLYPLLTFFGLSQNVSILFSILFSFSSTAVIVKILEEQGLLGNFPGSHVFVYLLLQDLFIVPVIFLLPVLFSQEKGIVPPSVGQFLVSAAEPLALFVIIFAASRFLLPRFLNIVFRYPSHELTILATIFTAALSIFLLTWVGLPASIAAFLAGVLISEQGKNLTPLAEIRPFRDLFLVLFFVMTGMLVNFTFFVTNLPYILGLTILIVLAKFTVIYCLLRFSKNSPSSSVFISTHLANVGEFAAVFAQIAFLSSFISQKDYNLALSVFILSLLLIPIWLRYFRTAFDKVAGIGLIGKFVKDEAEDESVPFQNLEKHVVICGHGRVGKQIRAMLESSEIPYVVIDFNKNVINHLREENKLAIYGDPTDEDILSAAFIQQARYLVVAVPDTFSQKRIITQAKRLNPNLIIYTRSHIEEDHADLKKIGANKIITPEFEAGVKIGEEILGQYDIPSEEISSVAASIRAAHTI